MSRQRNLRSFRRAALGGVALFTLHAVAGSTLVSCVGDEDDASTTGRRVTLTTTVELGSPVSFENAFQWEIELSKVLVSSGALYYFEGSPIDSEQARLTPVPVQAERLGLVRLLAPTTAHAHPGHYDPGEARGEMLTPSSFDLVAGPAALADGEGITGLVRSARFVWGDPPEGPSAEALGADVVALEGVARKGELVRPFRLAAARADVLDAEGAPNVEGCVFEEVDIQADGAVTLRVDPRVWLDQAEFDDVPESADGQPVTVDVESRARKAFVRGLQKSTAFSFTYSEVSP